MELYEKYNVVHIEGCRYYIVNLEAKEFSFENTLPYCCVINRVALYESSWKNMTVKVAEELDRISPKSKEELLAMKNSWGKQEVFSLQKKSNYQPFRDFYINTNHTAIHAMWTIQLLMHEYGVDLGKCKFILRRLPLAEPAEIREYEKEKAMSGFKEFLFNEANLSEEMVERIFKCIEIINTKVLPLFAKGYYNLYLIENPTYFSNYAGKALETIKKKNLFSAEICRLMEFSVSKLGEFVRLRLKENKIQFDEYKIIESTDSDGDIIDDFNDFDDF